MRFKKLTKEEQKKRDALIFTDEAFHDLPSFMRGYVGGCRSFEHMKPTLLKELLRLGYANEEEAQNEGPSLKELVEISDSLSADACAEFSGYVIESSRPDCRVTVDGVLISGKISSSVRRLWWDMLKRHQPDSNEERADTLYAWWD